jgi:hypothetical protein
LGPADVYNWIRAGVSSPDSDFVDLGELDVGPQALLGSIFVYRAAGNNAGQAATFRLYIDDVLVDEISNTFTADATFARALKLLYRATGSPGSDGPTLGSNPGEYQNLQEYNQYFSLTTARYKNEPVTSSFGKIRIAMKATAATVSSTYAAYFRCYPVSSLYLQESFSGQIATYRGSIDHGVVGGGYTTAYADNISVDGPGRIIGVGWVSSTSSNGLGTFQYRCKLVVDGYDFDEAQQKGQTGSTLHYTLLGNNEGFTTGSSNDAGSNPGQLSTFMHHPGVYFSDHLKLQTRVVSVPAMNTPRPVLRAYALIAPY